MTNPDAQNWRDIGPTSAAVYTAEFGRVMSIDLLPHAAELHAAAGPHSALALAHMWAENKYSTTGIMIRPEHNNPMALRPGPGIEVDYGLVPGPFLTFTTPVDCVREWRRRIESPTYKADQYPGGAYASTTTLKEYVYRYNPPGDTHPVTGEPNNSDKYMSTLVTMMKAYQIAENVLAPVPEPEKESIMAKPYVLLVAGHRSTGDAGAPAEKDKTDDMARAYLAAFRAAGYTVNYFQSELDADSTPDMTIGDLSTVATACRNILLGRKEEMCVMLDLHFNMPESALFTIVPDNVGLFSGYSDGAPADDTAVNNILDVQLAQTISAKIVARLGNKALYNGRLGVKGVMSERETGVALDGNWRLGMFGATAVVRYRAVRLVVEHGGTNDYARYPDFANKCAAGAVDAFNEVFKVAGTPVPSPTPAPVPLPGPVASFTYPEGMDAGVAAVLFGQAKANSGAVYKFDPNGDISRAWIARGKETGRFPALSSVQVYDGRQYFGFSSGEVFWRPSKTEVFRLLQ